MDPALPGWADFGAGPLGLDGKHRFPMFIPPSNLPQASRLLGMTKETRLSSNHSPWKLLPPFVIPPAPACRGTEANRRDLQLRGPFLEMFSTE
jgi:hypothetical protein